MHDLYLIQKQGTSANHGGLYRDPHELITAGVFLEGLVKVPCFESTANTVLKTNGL